MIGNFSARRSDLQWVFCDACVWLQFKEIDGVMGFTMGGDKNVFASLVKVANTYTHILPHTYHLSHTHTYTHTHNMSLTDKHARTPPTLLILLLTLLLLLSLSLSHTHTRLRRATATTFGRCVCSTDPKYVLAGWLHDWLADKMIGWLARWLVG